MDTDIQLVIIKETCKIESVHLKRKVVFDCYLPTMVKDPGTLELLLINDGQDMDLLGLQPMLSELYTHKQIIPLVTVGIHANEERKQEYGTSRQLDYEGRGKKAAAYAAFILQELIPFIKSQYNIASFRKKSIAGFSLGGLSAMDIAWNHPNEFAKVGVFSGSLWWRTKALDDGYEEATDRIMHEQVKKGNHLPTLKFFFQTGHLDETMDRNNNGIIDSIDDTISLIDILVGKGYDKKKDIMYLEMEDGKHDVHTWAKAMPVFLKWGFGAESSQV